jgi:GT2 family glycosyltransferase
VVNDDPSESIKTILKDLPNITIIENEKNLGFGPTVNKGVKVATGDYILLLNSDVLLYDDTYKKSFRYFTDNLVFAVSFAQKEASDQIVGKNKIFWHKGFLQHSRVENLQFGINGWAEGGSSLIDKKKFDVLKGFDPIYAPFYWEDIDLSYRAWKKGWKVFFDPQIVVEHHHETTISAFFNKKIIQTIAYRNQIICIWKNIHDTNLMVSHIINLALMIIKAAFAGDTVFLRGVAQAIKRLKIVLQSRKEVHQKIKDNEIFSQFSK